jgi:hypothetical protein
VPKKSQIHAGENTRERGMTRDSVPWWVCKRSFINGTNEKEKAARYGLRAAVPEIRAALRAVTRLLHRFDALNVSLLHPQ